MQKKKYWNDPHKLHSVKLAEQCTFIGMTLMRTFHVFIVLHIVHTFLHNMFNEGNIIFTRKFYIGTNKGTVSVVMMKAHLKVCSFIEHVE
jgi:hypothetical protein